MFERFTDKARRTVVLAQEEARLLRHDQIGTGHVLLGLLRESDSAAASALSSFGITLAAARENVQVAHAGSAASQSESGHIPFTPQAKRVIELALREALQLGHDYIGTEHILLGLVRDPECEGASVLIALGADLAAVRARVVELRPRALRRTHVLRSQRAVAEGGRIRLEGLLTRLSKVERFTGLTPDLADMDAELARLRREKEEAIDAQDFRLAEALSDAETELLVDRDRQATEWLQRPSLAAEVAQLRAEVERLRTVLRTHGLDADDPG